MRTTLLATVLVLAGVAPAAAQTAGVRIGVSGSPDQFFAGLHFETGPLIEQVHFRPNLEVGVGSSQTVVAVNFEFVGKFPIKREPWTVYAGAGPALVIDRVSNNVVSNTSTGGGFNILLGVEHTRGLFTEIKVGMIDSPSFKFAVGYTFPR